MSNAAPSIRAVPFDDSWPRGLSAELLTERQRHHLASIATVRFLESRAGLYVANSEADSIFLVSQGIMKSYRELRSGKKRVVAFLFPSDVLGLAQGGRYVNSAQAVTPVTLYAISVETLKESFQKDVALQFNFLCKVTHELRESQRQTMTVGRRDAPGKLAMFLEGLQRKASASDGDGNGGNGGNGNSDGAVIWLPMSRADVANYLGLSAEAVSRAASRLVRQGILAFPDRHHATVLDKDRLHKLAEAL